jgi:hypothetical protein
MRTTVFRSVSVSAAMLSTTWLMLLAALVLRCKLGNQPFPVLAKFSPFRSHMAAIDIMLIAFPWLALTALALIGLTYYYDRSIQVMRGTVLIFGASIVASLSAILLNPGGYFSWFLS